MEKHLKAATLFAQMLDNQFEFLGIRFGINAFLDLIPEIGDLLAAVLSLYLIWIAVRMRLPTAKIIAMIWNILVNFLIGLIPVIGDAAYIFRKANIKNLGIISQHANAHGHVIEGEVL